MIDRIRVGWFVLGMVDEGPSQWDGFLHDGEGIGEAIKVWKQEQNLSSVDRAEIEAKKKARKEADDKRYKEMYAQNLREIEEQEEKQQKKLAYGNMLKGLGDYLVKTRHITFPAANSSDREQGLVDAVEKRRAWIIAKHKEWQERYGAGGD